MGIRRGSGPTGTIYSKNLVRRERDRFRHLPRRAGVGRGKDTVGPRTVDLDLIAMGDRCCLCRDSDRLARARYRTNSSVRA